MNTSTLFSLISKNEERLKKINEIVGDSFETADQESSPSKTTLNNLSIVSFTIIG